MCYINTETAPIKITQEDSGEEGLANKTGKCNNTV